MKNFVHSPKITGRMNISCTLWFLRNLFLIIFFFWAFQTALEALFGKAVSIVIVVLLCLAFIAFAISCKPLGDRIIKVADDRMPGYASKELKSSIESWLDMSHESDKSH